MWKKETPTDGRVVAAVLGGQVERFAVLVERYLPVAHATAYAYTRNQHDAEDVVQEAFLKAYRSLASLRDPNNVGGWLCAIVRNLALNAVAKRKRESTMRDALERFPATVAEPDVGRQEIRELLRRHIEGMAEDGAEVLLLHYYAGKSTGEIAALVGISRHAAKKRLERARKTLNDSLLAALAVGPEEQGRDKVQLKHIMGLVAGAGMGERAVAGQEGIRGGKSGGVSGVARLAAWCGAGLVLVGGSTFLLFAGMGDGGGSKEPAVDRAEVTVGAVASGVGDGGLAVKAADPVVVPLESGGLEEGDAVLASAPIVAEGGTTRIYGTVVNEESGKAVADEELELHLESVAEGYERPEQGIYGTRTAEDGTFEFAELTPGRYALKTGSMKAYVSHQRLEYRGSVAAGESLHWTVRLSQGIAIRGRVVDAAGAPLASVEVRGLTNQENTYRRGTSLEDGTFVIPGFKGGGSGFKVDAAKRGYAMAPQTGLIVSPEGLSDLELVMVPEAVISGRVVDATGAPVPEAGVWVAAVAPVAGEMTWDTADERGEFAVKALYPSTYVLGLKAPDVETWSRDTEIMRLDVAEGKKQSGLELTLQGMGGLSIEGVVKNAVWPVSNTMLFVAGKHFSVAEDGSFTVIGLEPGPYHLTFLEGMTPGRSLSVPDVEAGTMGLEVAFDALSGITGVVVDKATGDPVTRFDMTTEKGVHAEMTGHHMWQLKEERSSDGTFELTDMATPAMTLFVRVAGYAPAIVPVTDIVPGETVTGVVVALDRGLTLSGTVVDREGAPISGAAVFDGPLPQQQMFTHAARAITDGDGHFAFQVLPDGERILSAYHADYAPTEIAVAGKAAAQGGLKVVLTNGGTIRGVAAMDGINLGGRTVLLMRNGVDISRTTLDEEGNFELPHVPTGEVSVRLALERLDSRKKCWFYLVGHPVVGDGATVEIALSSGLGNGVVEGTVSGRREDIRYHVRLSIESGGGTDLETSTTLDEDGTFYFDNLPPGPVRAELSVLDRGGSPEVSWDFDLGVLPVDGVLRPTLSLD